MGETIPKSTPVDWCRIAREAEAENAALRTERDTMERSRDSWRADALLYARNANDRLARLDAAREAWARVMAAAQQPNRYGEWRAAVHDLDDLLSGGAQTVVYLREHLDAALDAINRAMCELGVPQPGCPAPVANAYHILDVALAHGIQDAAHSERSASHTAVAAPCDT